MPIWFPALMIAVLGSVSLTLRSFAPGKAVRLVAALVPPWQAGGMARAAATGLPVAGLAGIGHVLLLDTGGDARALAQRRAAGLWLLDARGAVGCGRGVAAGAEDRGTDDRGCA